MEEQRLTRSQRDALMMLICAETIIRESGEDLNRRMQGDEAWAAARENAKKDVKNMVNSVLATMNQDQLRHLSATARDYELKLKPKLMLTGTNIVMDKETLKALVDAAQEKCVSCVEEAEGSKHCRLQRILSAIIPMPSYDGFLCPYNNREWEN